MNPLRMRITDTWVGVAFIVGASCFMLGGASASVAAGWDVLGDKTLNLVFAIGAVFFTLAAWGQYLQTVNSDPDQASVGGADGSSGDPAWSWFGIRANSLGWWASVVQLAGTLMFNLMTLDALKPDLLGLRTDLLVWSPDMVGSLCFLIASQLALMETCRRTWCFQWHSRSWWIAVVNLAGAIAFQISAFFGWYRPGSAVPVGPWWDNYWTFVGALCFLIGAILLLPMVSWHRQARH